ncbi:Glycosyl transferase family 2 [Lachnospiraceae bacterium NLAE-zl-G231]|nr:Glycosyl transferase family 2 [Lachnospiraceae bacterium NLAE-zl-G231]
MYRGEDLTFAICAYKKSKYLEECVKSIIDQDIKSNVIITTSTPNKYINDIAEKFKVPLYINSLSNGIAEDWNYAYRMCSTDLVTLGHQDDIYNVDFSKEILTHINMSSKPLIAFTNYNELRNGIIVTKNNLLRTKRILLYPLRFKNVWNSKWIRRRILSLGSAICCPSVTFVKPNLPENIFQIGMKSNIDWEAWEMISKRSGSFVYCSKPVINHRIHEESTTSDIIKSGIRYREDLFMFQKFWPKWFAVILEKIYIKGEKSNGVK